MLVNAPKFESILRLHKMRVTGARQAIYESLAGHNQPISVKRLIYSLSDVMDTATVYRNIQKFEDIGVVNKVYTGWKYRLELSEKFRPHHHHFTCFKCGDIIPLQLDPKLESSISRLGRNRGLKVKEHEIELRGLCKNCQ